MDLPIATGFSVPIVATAILAIAAVASRAPCHEAPAPALEPSFIGNCERHDYALLTDHIAVDSHFACAPGRFHGRGAFVMTGREMHVFGAGMRELATPHGLALADRDSVAVRAVDVDGDGIDEVILWSADPSNLASCSLPEPRPVACKPVRIRVVAIRDGKLALSDWHRYETNISPIGAARWIVTHDHFGASR